MPTELKALLAALAVYLKANKAEGLALIDAFEKKEDGYVEADVQAEIDKIGNYFVKAAAEWVWSTYGPQLPTLLEKYEGDAYDKLVAFLQAESK